VLIPLEGKNGNSQQMYDNRWWNERILTFWKEVLL